MQLIRIWRASYLGSLRISLLQNWVRYQMLFSEIVFFVIVAIWGITFVVSKDALQVVGPLTYNTSRMVLGGITLAILAGSHWKQVNRSYIWPAIVTGTVVFLSYTAQSYGQQFTTASKAGFLTGTNLIYIPIFSAILLKRFPSRFALLGVAIAFVGLSLLSVQGSLTELQFGQGDIAVALGGIGWALYFIVLAHYSPKFNVLVFGALHVFVASLMSGITWLWLEPATIPLTSFPFWVGVISTGFLILGLGTSIQTWVMRWASPTRVGVIATLEPLFAGLAGW